MPYYLRHMIHSGQSLMMKSHRQKAGVIG